MKDYKSIIKIIIPSLVSILVLKITNLNLDYFPMFFGVIVGIFNWNIHKFNPYLGTILSVLVSYLCYGLGILSFGIFMPIGELISDNSDLLISKDKLGRIAYIVSPFVIAPLLTFIGYRFVFRIQKTRLTFIIIIISISVLVLQAYFFFEKISLSSSDLKYSVLNTYITWQGIMLLSLQLILYQERLMKKTSDH